VDQPDILVESPQVLSKKDKKKMMKKKMKRAEDALYREEYTSTRFSEFGGPNHAEIPLPALDKIPEPEAEPKPVEESAAPEEEPMPEAVPAEEPLAEEESMSEAEPIPEAVPAEEPVPQDKQHFGFGYGYGYDYQLRQNDGKIVSNCLRLRRGTDSMIPIEVAESTVTGEQEIPQSPLYLPFSAQHRLMTHLQHRLEAICFSFGQQHMPEKLRAEGWDCPEAVELNVWTMEFRSARCFKDRLPKATQRWALLSSVANIRNYAVSRTRIDSAELEKVLVSAAELAIVLGEEGAMFEKLREEVISTNKWLGEETDQLQKRLDAKLNVFEAARAKVDALEEGTRASFDKGLLKRQNAAHAKVLMAIERAGADQLAEVTDRSIAPSSLDWVNGLENSLMLGDDSQEESLV
jgi:predicted outer membrane protein